MTEQNYIDMLPSLDQPFLEFQSFNNAEFPDEYADALNFWTTQEGLLGTQDGGSLTMQAFDLQPSWSANGEVNRNDELAEDYSLSCIRDTQDVSEITFKPKRSTPELDQYSDTTENVSCYALFQFIYGKADWQRR